MELSSPKIKKVLIFSQKNPFLPFWEMDHFLKSSNISGGNFPGSKNKMDPL